MVPRVTEQGVEPKVFDVGNQAACYFVISARGYISLRLPSLI